MNQIYPGTHSLQSKFQKVCRQIETLLQAGKTFSFEKIAGLMKRRERYAKQLLLQPSAVMKAGGALLLASALSLTSHAQSATYVRADSINPIHRTGLPQGVFQPTFVDIDGDGDLDCFETSSSQTYGRGIKLTFLRNTGTKSLPYYQLDTTSFPKYLPTYPPPTSSDKFTRLQFVDIDGDGDYDMFAGDRDGYPLPYGVMVYYKNVGTAKKAKFVNTPTENPLSSVRSYYEIQFAFADFDKDGDFDVITTDSYGSNTFYKNTGTATQPQFTAQKSQFGLGDFYPAPYVFAYDYNKDGRTDVFFADPYFKVGKLSYYRNEAKQKGGLQFVLDTATVPKMPSGFITYEFVDLNNDGIAEAFTEDGQYAVVSKTAVANKQSIALPAVSGAIAVKAYPNPFAGSFVVSLGSATANSVIKITDLQGRVVSTVKANSSTAQLGSDLQKGVYMVQVIQDTKVIFTQKVIKQ